MCIRDRKNSRPYYYRHYVQLSQICPVIYEMQVSVLRDVSDVLTESFQNFADNGMLKREFSEEYGSIIKAIMALMIHGLPDIYQMQEAERNALTLKCIWSILIPCLTERGYEEYLSISKEEPS